jgi:hypothetical protein
VVQCLPLVTGEQAEAGTDAGDAPRGDPASAGRDRLYAPLFGSGGRPGRAHRRERRPVVPADGVDSVFVPTTRSTADWRPSDSVTRPRHGLLDRLYGSGLAEAQLTRRSARRAHDLDQDALA